MPATKNERERERILHLVEAGQVSATEAARLLDALDSELDYAREPAEHRREHGRDRVMRIRFTNLHPRPQKLNMTATIPLSLIRASVRLGVQLVPQLGNSAVQDLLRSIDSGAAGRLLDVQDLEKGERLEIFVE